MFIGFFIEPDLRTRKLIISYKKLIKKKYGNQIYLNHPPHLTLFTIKLKNKFLKKDFFKISKFINNLKKTIIKIKRTNFFYNDPLTKGNTMLFTVKKNSVLKDNQIKLIKFIKSEFGNFIIKDKKFKGLMQKNYTLYGYPFVGKNWKPHFTISSINKKKNLKVIEPHIIKNIDKSFLLKKISVWHIKKNIHKKIKMINLK